MSKGPSIGFTISEERKGEPDFDAASFYRLKSRFRRGMRIRIKDKIPGDFEFDTESNRAELKHGTIVGIYNNNCVVKIDEGGYNRSFNWWDIITRAEVIR